MHVSTWSLYNNVVIIRAPATQQIISLHESRAISTNEQSNPQIQWKNGICLCHARHQPNPFSPRQQTIHRFRSLLASQSTAVIPQSKSLPRNHSKELSRFTRSFCRRGESKFFTESADIFRAREGVLCDSDRSRWIFWTAFDCVGYFRWCLFISAVLSGVSGGPGKFFRSVLGFDLRLNWNCIEAFSRFLFLR